MDFDLVKKLLKTFGESNLKTSSYDETNYFDITGFPHHENVVSNILKFFFTTDGEHEFGNIWLKALLKSYGLKDGVDGLSTSENQVIREYSNGSQDRIDLLIDCSPYIIIVENKIYADLYNDLSNYERMAKNYIRDNGLDIDNKHIVKIVLSLSPIKQSKLENGFKNVTYDMLFTNLEKIQVSNKWSCFQNEFMKNIQRLKETSIMKLDPKWAQIAESDSFSQLIVYNNEVNKKMERFLKNIKSKLDVEKKTFVKAYGIYNPEHMYHMSLYININIFGQDIVLETSFTKRTHGEGVSLRKYGDFGIYLWNRREKTFNDDDPIIKCFKDKCETRIEYWGKCYVLDKFDIFNDGVTEDEIASKLNGYLNALFQITKD